MSDLALGSGASRDRYCSTVLSGIGAIPSCVVAEENAARVL